MTHAAELHLTERELRGAIKVWCRGNRYWTSLVEGAARVYLNGEKAGEVTSADAARAVHLESNRAAPADKAANADSAAQAVSPAAEAGKEVKQEADATPEAKSEASDEPTSAQS